MRVQDLIDELETFDPNAEVVFSYGYGDYWSTTVAATPERVSEGHVVYSAYHQQDKVVELDEDEMDSDGRLVVIIS